jgi:hypothetical protein
MPLEPTCASTWPGKAHRHVNVLLEGPSIRELDVNDLMDGPVVAVNRAILLSDRIPIDCWATVDQPSNLWGTCKEHLHPETTLFTSGNNLSMWEDLIGDEVYQRMYSWNPTYMGATDDDPEGFFDCDGRPPLMPTIFHVLPWLSFLEGTEHVRLFGCDMRGAGAALGDQEPFTEEGHAGWKFRWDVERRMLALSTKKFRERGQRIDRWAKKA